MDRNILHLNIDNFAASVEQNRQPDLKGKPVIVGVPKGNTSGVVVSASKEARKFGVVDDMSLRRAQRMCPGAVVISADYAAYRQVFDDFLELCSRYSPLLEPDGLGSAWMDVTGSGDLFGQPREIAERILRSVANRLELSLSIGCASNKLLARIASGMGKKFIRVVPGGETQYLAALPITTLGAVTSKIAKRLTELGVTKLGQLAGISESLLVRQFGSVGSVLKRQSMGVDFSPVKAAYPPEVVAIEYAGDSPFEEPAQIEQRLVRMVGKALVRLDKKNALAGEVTLVLFDESTPIPAYFRFKKPTRSASMILQALGKLVGEKMQPGMEISRVRVVLSDIAQGEGYQLSLVENGRNRDRLNATVEMVRERFGDDAVFYAASLVPTSRGQLLPEVAT